jgi:catechol 2,3-dioxygenase-like lactoylglutathione lyase family enzyme
MKLIVDIKVSDLDRAILFYTETLGFQCRAKQDTWAAILIGDAEIHLYLHGGTKGHVEFYADDIHQKVKELASKGVEFHSGIDKPEAISVDESGITTFPWGKTAFFKDSEGNELAVVQDKEV